MIELAFLMTDRAATGTIDIVHGEMLPCHQQGEDQQGPEQAMAVSPDGLLKNPHAA